MQVYDYDSDTGEYLGISIAQESPKEPGQYLLPANATKTAPPPLVLNEAAVYDAATDGWNIVADFRGNTYWLNGAEGMMLTLGPLPAGASLIPPPPTTAQLIAHIMAKVDEHIDSVARQDHWDSRYTCIGRAGYPGPWQAHAQAFGAWMDSCYQLCYAQQAAVTAGTVAAPTDYPSADSFAATLIASFPVMTWPA